MNPKLALEKLISHRREDKPTTKEWDKLLQGYLNTLKYDVMGYAYGRNNYKEPKYSLYTYEKLFLMVGAAYEYNNRALHSAAKLFPEKVLAVLPKRVKNQRKLNILRIYFSRCIMPLLFVGGQDNHRSGGEKLGDAQGQFGYIPSTYEYILGKYLKKSSYLEGKRFIDIGCGIGDKTILVHMLQLPIKAEGIEYDYINVRHGQNAKGRLPKYCTYCGKVAGRIPGRVSCLTIGCKNNFSGRPKARGYYKHKECFIRLQDAFKFQHYKAYDRIYTYSPINNTDVSQKFYDHIWERLSVGTEWYEVYVTRRCLEQGRKHGAKEIGKPEVGHGYHPVLIKDKI
jgi:hypothetical protein